MDECDVVLNCICVHKYLFMYAQLSTYLYVREYVPHTCGCINTVCVAFVLGVYECTFIVSCMELCLHDACVYMYMCICMCVLMCIHVCIRMYTYIYMCVRVCACVYVHMCICVCMCIPIASVAHEHACIIHSPFENPPTNVQYPDT